jgi:polyisoprenoid-binding protein YceI
MTCRTLIARAIGCRAAPLALAAALAGALALPGAAAAEPAEYRLDPEHVTVAFMVSHIGYADTLGQFLEVEGGFVFDETAPSVSDLRVEIQADSVFTAHERRDEHVRSDDFLAADDHPEIVFVMTGAEQTGPRTGTVVGDLTIRGVTNPASLEVTWNKSGKYPFNDTYVTGISARTTVKRSDFGMTYALENGLVGDEVEILIEAEAIRQD